LAPVLCSRCGKTIVTAEASERQSKKTQYASSFVAYLMPQKCMVSMPINLLEAMLSHFGMKVARSTMTELFYRAAQKMEPLQPLLFQAVLLPPFGTTEMSETAVPEAERR
jgi:transposase